MVRQLTGKQFLEVLLSFAGGTRVRMVRGTGGRGKACGAAASRRIVSQGTEQNIWHDHL